MQSVNSSHQNLPKIPKSVEEVFKQPNLLTSISYFLDTPEDVKNFTLTNKMCSQALRGKYYEKIILNFLDPKNENGIIVLLRYDHKKHIQLSSFCENLQVSVRVFFDALYYLYQNNKIQYILNMSKGQWDNDYESLSFCLERVFYIALCELIPEPQDVDNVEKNKYEQLVLKYANLFSEKKLFHIYNFISLLMHHTKEGILQNPTLKCEVVISIIKSLKNNILLHFIHSYYPREDFYDQLSRFLIESGSILKLALEDSKLKEYYFDIEKIVQSLNFIHLLQEIQNNTKVYTNYRNYKFKLVHSFDNKNIFVILNLIDRLKLNIFNANSPKSIETRHFLNLEYNRINHGSKTLKIKFINDKNELNLQELNISDFFNIIKLGYESASSEDVVKSISEIYLLIYFSLVKQNLNDDLKVDFEKIQSVLTENGYDYFFDVQVDKDKLQLEIDEYVNKNKEALIKFSDFYDQIRIFLKAAKEENF